MAKRFFNTGSSSDAQSDRRIESRSAISGSGMMTDPERIRALEEEQERRQRAWRQRTRSFQDSLTQSAVEADEQELSEEDLTETMAEDDLEATDVLDDSWDGDGEVTMEGKPASRTEHSRLESRTGGAVSGGKRVRTLPRLPPDPRVNQLNQQLDNLHKKGQDTE